MRIAYVALLLFALAFAFIVAFYTSLSSVLRFSAKGVASDTSVLYLFYAPVAVLGFFGLATGLVTFFSHRLVFTQIAGAGAAAVVLVCVVMIFEAMLKGPESSGLSLTLGRTSYGLPLSFWIGFPLFSNASVLLLAQMKSARFF